MYCKIYKEAIRQRKALSRTSSNIVLNSVHHHRSSTRHHHHQQMLLQAAADTGELALHTAHFTVPTELHAVNGEWDSVRQKKKKRKNVRRRIAPVAFSSSSRNHETRLNLERKRRHVSIDIDASARSGTFNVSSSTRTSSTMCGANITANIHHESPRETEKSSDQRTYLRHFEMKSCSSDFRKCIPEEINPFVFPALPEEIRLTLRGS